MTRLLCSVLVLFSAAVATAQTATRTATPTATATATATYAPNLPTPLTIPLYQQSMTVHLFDSVTAAQSADPVQVDAFPYVLIQVDNETATCSSLSIQVIGSVDGQHWVPLPINGGNSTITDTDVPVLTARAWQIPTGFKYVTAIPYTVSSCQVSAIIEANR